MMTTTTTPNGKPKKRGPDVYHDMRELIQTLMDHPLSPKEMMDIQNKHEVNFKWGHGNFHNMLQYLGNFEPLYEYSFRRYKILTLKDIEDYREEIKNGK